MLVSVSVVRRALPSVPSEVRKQKLGSFLAVFAAFGLYFVHLWAFLMGYSHLIFNFNFAVFCWFLVTFVWISFI